MENQGVSEGSNGPGEGPGVEGKHNLAKGQGRAGSTGQYRAVQYRTVQGSTVQGSTGQYRAGDRHGSTAGEAAVQQGWGSLAG